MITRIPVTELEQAAFCQEESQLVTKPLIEELEINVNWQEVPKAYLRLDPEIIKDRIFSAKAKLSTAVTILGHHYQREEVIQFEDVTGDSFKLSQYSARQKSKWIVFCGVRFMAETADVVSDDWQKVILPNLAAGCSMADMAPTEQVQDAWLEILSNVGLLNQRNAYARTLSGGMRRRLLVAKALVHNPEIIILDEPTAGVDVDLRNNLWKYILELNKKGTTICLTTHYLEEAENLCDYIIIIDKGKIIKEDTKKNLLNLIGTKTVSFILDQKYQIPKSLKKYHANINSNNNLILNYDKKNTHLKEIIDLLNKEKISFNEINTYESDLEDVFLDLIKNNNS